jgi:hypothetical protein
MPRDLGGLEIDGHVVGQPTEPASGCEEPCGFGSVMGASHIHDDSA